LPASFSFFANLAKSLLIGIPSPSLIPLEDVPAFSFARKDEINIWEQVDLFRRADALLLPFPPAVDDNRWCGMEELEKTT
jgi:hypothetical protein